MVWERPKQGPNVQLEILKQILKPKIVRLKVDKRKIKSMPVRGQYIPLLKEDRL